MADASAASVARTFHADEVAVDEALVRELLADQFPEWAGLSIERVLTSGTDHVLHRVGDELVMRLPRQEGVDTQIDKEREWLPRLAPHLPLAVPVPAAKGRPTAGYPFSWSVYRWLEGSALSDEAGGWELARDLAAFLRALQDVDPTAGPLAGEQNFGRGEPLASRDTRTRAAIGELAGQLDAAAVTAAWEHALAARPWHGSPVWLHGDLMPENLLVRGGRLAAVIDWGCLGVGDPACDLMIAWSVLTRDARSLFRTEVGADEATWSRARGWALSTGLIALPYYAATHPPRAANARHRIAEAVADLAGDAS